MGSKGIKQNFGSAIGRHVAKTPEDISREKRQLAHAQSVRDDAHNKRMIDNLSEALMTISELKNKLREAEGQITEMEKTINAYGAKKTLPDVISDEDLLKSKGATAKRVPNKKVKKVDSEDLQDEVIKEKKNEKEIDN